MSRKADLTREEWLALGEKAKMCQDLLLEIARTVGGAASVRQADRIMRVGRRLDEIKRELEDIADRHVGYAEEALER